MYSDPLAAERLALANLNTLRNIDESNRRNVDNVTPVDTAVETSVETPKSE